MNESSEAEITFMDRQRPTWLHSNFAVGQKVVQDGREALQMDRGNLKADVPDDMKNRTAFATLPQISARDIAKGEARTGIVVKLQIIQPVWRRAFLDELEGGVLVVDSCKVDCEKRVFWLKQCRYCHGRSAQSKFWKLSIEISQSERGTHFWARRFSSEFFSLKKSMYGFSWNFSDFSLSQDKGSVSLYNVIRRGYNQTNERLTWLACIERSKTAAVCFLHKTLAWPFAARNPLPKQPLSSYSVFLATCFNNDELIRDQQ